MKIRHASKFADIKWLQVSDPPAKDSLAGNPTLVGSSGDPDRSGEEQGEENLPLTFSPLPATAPRPPRPLLDLFPIAGVERDRASGFGGISGGGAGAVQPAPSPVPDATRR